MKRLLATVLTVSLAGTTIANAYTNKTYLETRPVIFNLPLWKTTIGAMMPNADNGRNGVVQAIGFYQGATEHHKIGQYFLVDDKSTIQLKATPTGTGHFKSGTFVGNNSVGTAKDVDLTYLLHAYGMDPNIADKVNAADLTLSLHPMQSICGVGLSYHQSYKQLFFTIDMPVVQVKHSMQIKVMGGDQPIEGVIAPYLQGEYSTISINDPDPEVFNGNGQIALTHAKMSQCRTAAGVADIDIKLGGMLVNAQWAHLGLALGITLPTGNEPHGEYAFEPVAGNGGHLGIGGDLYVDATIIKRRHHKLDIVGKGMLRYLVKAYEKRTLGLKNRPFGQYYLLGKVGKEKLIPAANVLTRNVEVTPGVLFDGMLGISYNYRCFVLDLGYNIYARQTACVTLCSRLEEDTYALTARGYSTVTTVPPLAVRPFTITPANVDGGDLATAVISKDTIDITVAQTPAQCTHSIYSAIGYVAANQSRPLMIGIGGKYEWSPSNSALSQWSIWGKVGIGF